MLPQGVHCIGAGRDGVNGAATARCGDGASRGRFKRGWRATKLRADRNRIKRGVHSARYLLISREIRRDGWLKTVKELMVRSVTVALLLMVFLPQVAVAQQGVWIQVEAQPTLREASERARSYAGRFGNVTGFAMTTGWYAIALGPYPRIEAEERLGQLRQGGAIPRDSYINTGANFRQRFWPVGAVTAPAAPALETVRIQPPSEATAVQPPAPGAVGVQDQTPAEARAAEAALDQAGREEVQAALRWRGFYEGAIDGAFGPGTRSAMTDWQGANGFDRTGVLTTAQRRALFDAYEQDLAALGLTELRDETAGIEMQIPGAMVAFAGYEPPFARFAAVGDSGVELLLISQPGTRARMAAMYEVLQDLAIIPSDGPRGLTAQGFTVNGQDATRSAHAEARLEDGVIKGFVLSWPRRDDGRFARVLPIMRASFRALGGAVLTPTAGDRSLPQGRDLLAGLDLRRADRIRSGFFVTPGGTVLTSAEAVAGCGKITVLDGTEMDMDFADAALGLAALRPRARLAPLGYARLRAAPPRIDSEIAVAGYAYGDALRMPVLSFGEIADLRGFDGRDDRLRLAVTVEPGDTGGPVLDPAGAVLGLLQPRHVDGARLLPDEVNFATPAAAILGALDGLGLRADSGAAMPPLAPEDLARHAADMTVMVSCWN